MRSYKVIWKHFIFDMGSVVTEVKGKKRIFKTIVTDWKYNYIIEDSDLLNEDIFKVINT